MGQAILSLPVMLKAVAHLVIVSLMTVSGVNKINDALSISASKVIASHLWRDAQKGSGLISSFS